MSDYEEIQLNKIFRDGRSTPVTAYITHPDCLKHEMGVDHLESPDRLRSIFNELERRGLVARLQVIDAPLATRGDLLRVHRPRYVDYILSRTPPPGGYWRLGRDTALNSNSVAAALRAAGAGIKAVELVTEGRAENAFCAVRPPGHHATSDEAMGFCIFNNIAIAAAYALEKRDEQRVVIIDFDVHRGNGTEKIFADDNRVLICSLFQQGLYPSGRARPSYGNIISIALPAGASDAVVRDIVNDYWIPAIEFHKPHLFLISAGFDAHEDDPLGEMALTERSYGWITEQIMALARKHGDAGIVSILEGGYDLRSLGDSVAAHVGVLARKSCSDGSSRI